MPTFLYTAKDNRGVIKSGRIFANDVIEVRSKLISLGFEVNEIQEEQTFKPKNGVLQKIGLSKAGRVPLKDVVFFTRQLATMIQAGVPLVRAVQQLGKTQLPVFKAVLEECAKDISSGNSLSAAMARHPNAFTSMYVSVVEAGEVSGSLDTTLEQISTYLEEVEARKAKVKAAMRYPKFVISTVFLITLGILWKLVPVFEKMYGANADSLPWGTKILIAASHLIRDHIVLFFIGLVACFLGIKILLANDILRKKAEVLLLKVPVFGPILEMSIWANFARTLALLIKNGNNILVSLEITAKVVDHQLYEEKILAIRDRLQGGMMLSQSIEMAKLFPPLIIQMAETGEASGQVDELFVKGAEFYEREIKNSVDSLSSLIEPIMIVVMGSIVGFVLISLYMPVFNVGKLIHK